MPPATSNIFESVNLESTLGSVKAPIRTRIPDSTSGTSEEDELDPEDFLSPRSPIVHRMETVIEPDIRLKVEKASDGYFKPNQKLEASFLSSTASLSLGHLSLSTNTIRDESPSENLLRQNALLLKQLYQQCKLHKCALKKGDSRLDRSRVLIGQILQSLSENHYALHLLYSKEKARLTKLEEEFAIWDQRRSEILQKIQGVKSEKSDEGLKLTTLLDKNATIDEQISQLEIHIANLKLKKQVIVSEIGLTASVLESQTSAHVDEFRGLEEKIQLGITELFSGDGSTLPDLSNLISFIPVDVTFSKSYRPHPDVSYPLIVDKSVRAHENDRNGQRDELSSPRDVDLSQLNREHGPTAYEKGFSEGNSLSAAIKAHLQQLLASWTTNTKKPTVKTPIVVDDISNTVNEKVDISPIRALLRSKITAITLQIEASSLKAALFHKQELLWRDCINVIKVHEEKIEMQILESTTLSSSHKKFVQIMTSALDKVTIDVEDLLKESPGLLQSSFDGTNRVKKCLEHEIDAIVSALAVVEPQEDVTHYVTHYRELVENK